VRRFFEDRDIEPRIDTFRARGCSQSGGVPADNQNLLH
jgi:hypothetical protein